MSVVGCQLIQGRKVQGVRNKEEESRSQNSEVRSQESEFRSAEVYGEQLIAGP